MRTGSIIRAPLSTSHVLHAFPPHSMIMLLFPSSWSGTLVQLHRWYMRWSRAQLRVLNRTRYVPICA